MRPMLFERIEKRKMVPRAGIEPATRGFSIFQGGFEYIGKIRTITLRFNVMVAVLFWRFPALYI